jgi:hypothetical protein
MADELGRILEEIKQALARGARVDSAAQPSSFGPLQMPQPGQAPEAQVLRAAGLPDDALEGLLAHRSRPDFFERVQKFAREQCDAFPRLSRLVAWALLREDPRWASRLAEAVLTHGDLGAPGEIALLCDLAEEDPRALVPFLPRLLEHLLAGDRADPAEGDHRLSDLFCLTEIPSAFLAAEVAPRLPGVADPRVRQILLRLLVFHRAIPLQRRRGVLEERLHRPRTRYQAYAYAFLSEGDELCVVDLSQEIQLNLSMLPKYAPSMALRRFTGRDVETEGFADPLPGGETAWLLREIALARS